MVIKFHKINLNKKLLYMIMFLMKIPQMKNFIWNLENILLIIYFKDITVQCLLMDKQDLVKHIQYKEMVLVIWVCAIEL